jgi:hypothetical protein
MFARRMASNPFGSEAPRGIAPVDDFTGAARCAFLTVRASSLQLRDPAVVLDQRRIAVAIALDFAEQVATAKFPAGVGEAARRHENVPALLNRIGNGFWEFGNVAVSVGPSDTVMAILTHRRPQILW